MNALYRRTLARISGMIDAEAPADGPPPRTLWSFFRWALAGSGLAIGLATAISAFTGASEVLTMWLLGRVVDAVGAGAVAEAWPFLLGAVILLLVLRPIFFGLSATFQSMVIAPGAFTLVLSRLHRYTLGQSVTFFDNDFAGRIAQKQMQTARAMTDVVIETVNAVLFGLASVIGAALLVGAVDLRLVGIMVAWLTLYSLFLRWFMPRIRARSKARAAARANVSGQVVDTITNIKTVKLFARSEFEDRAALGAMRSFQARQFDFGSLSVAFRLGLIFMAGILPLAVVGAGLMLPAASAGDIAAMGAVSIRLAQMTGWVSFTLMGIYGNIGEVEDGMNTLTPAHALRDADGAGMLDHGGAIVFDGVSFGYGRDVGGVRDIDLTVAPGEKIGLVGASGAGKSTLVALLLRLYDVEAGRITIGGRDIAGVEQESLRRMIGMVTQDTAMFNRSARENILYGRPDASEDALIAAARRAEAHAFITELADFAGRDGYDAHLGERGVKLSGGQRQRIALARAILKDAPILVLDEATSALDSEVEASIQAALDRVMEGKTVIAIAHRLSTIARMDRIVVLEAGRIVEEGTHDALLARDGLYARYWRRQSGGFLGHDAAAHAAE